MHCQRVGAWKRENGTWNLSVWYMLYSLCNCQYRHQKMKRQARITLKVECNTCLFVFFSWCGKYKDEYFPQIECILFFFFLKKSKKNQDSPLFAVIDVSGRAVKLRTAFTTPRAAIFNSILGQTWFVFYDTCWWYSLCNFQYPQHYENTCLYNFDCWIYTNMYFFIFMLCLNTMTSMIKTNVFSILLIFRFVF